MPLCFPSCHPTLPIPISIDCCGISGRRIGGIQRLVFTLCTLDTSNIANWSTVEWCNYIRTGQIVITPKLLANKPESSYQKRKLSSCSAETVIGITHKIEFEDNNFDAESHLDNSFWQEIAKNPQNYPFGYIDCGGYFTGFMNPVGMEVSHVIPDTNNESAYWKGAIEFNSLELPAPIFIAHSLEAILANCAKVPNYNSCTISGEDRIYYFNDVSAGCSQGDVLLIAPYYKDATYIWYLDGVEDKVGRDRTYAPPVLGLHVEVLIKIDCCAEDTSCFIRTKVDVSVRRNENLYNSFGMSLYSYCGGGNPPIPYFPTPPFGNLLYTIGSNAIGPTRVTMAQALVDAANNLGPGYRGYFAPGDPPTTITLESPCDNNCPCSNDTLYYWYYSSDVAGEIINVGNGRCITGGGNLIGPIVPTDLNAGGLVPTVSSVTVSSDGTGYFKLEVIPTSSVAGMEYRLVNSLGYETAWQVSNIFRGVIGGDTKIMIRVRGNSCITTYNLNLS